MFGRSKKNNGEEPKNSSQGISWQVPYVHPNERPASGIIFGIIFALAVAELILSVDAFVYLQKEDKWWSFTEKARMGFLIFSAARTIFLSFIYALAHCRKVKNLMNTLHTIFLVLSTIFWIVSGVLIHQMWGYVECQNNGIANSFDEFKSQVEGGLSLCHEIKIIEIIAWTIAGFSVLATIPVVKTYLQRRKDRMHKKNGGINGEKGQTV